jgi:hypothetical protein
MKQILRMEFMATALKERLKKQLRRVLKRAKT